MRRFVWGGSLVLTVVLVASSLWLYSTRFWLRDNYRDGFEAGMFMAGKNRHDLCASEVQARFDVTVSIGMPEDAAAFLAGCYDGAQDRRYRSEVVGSLVAEILEQ